MKFKVEQQDLIKALNAVSRIVPKMASIYSNVKIENLVNCIRFTATNSVTSIQYDIPAEEIDGTFILINPLNLLPIVSRLNGTINFDNGILKAGKSKFKIPYSNAEYINIDFDFHNDPVEVDIKELKTALTKTIYARSTIENQIISGIYINDKEVVATDGNILVINKIENKIGNFVITKECANEIIKLFDSETVYISNEKNKIIISNGDIVLVTQCLVGVYPSYKKLLPKELEYKITINKQDFINNLELVAPVLNQQTKLIELIINNDIITLSVNNGDSTADTDIECKSNCNNITIKFCADYLLQAIKNFTGDKFNIKFNNAQSPCVFDTKIDYCLIMPRIK